MLFPDERPVLPTQVRRHTFQVALGRAQFASDKIAASTSKISEMPELAVYYLAPDGKSGFGITVDRVLVGVFSLVKGRGPDMIRYAVEQGAAYLDCFDGFLPGYYEQFGFEESGRSPNWTPGEPDLVFMSHKSVRLPKVLTHA